MAGSEGSTLPLRLQVDVLRASKVSACDPNGKSDPYCIVYLGSTEHTHKTEVKSATLDPVWNETFSFQGKHLAQFVTASDSGGDLQLSGYIVFDVWDHDVVNQDDFLGRVMIPLREIPPDTSVGETWYPLMNRNAKDSVSGSLCVRTYLRVDSDKTLERGKMDAELYQVCKSRGYHLPICSGKTFLELPGRTEHIEMAFSHVFVDVSSYHCTAQVYLTNYRLLILSTSNLHQAPSRFHGHGATMDLSMWIALNNIMSVDMGTEASVIRKSRSKTQTMAITVNCYDFRSVKLVFILDAIPPKSTTSISVTGTESLERSQKLGHQLQPSKTESPKVGRKILRLASGTVSTLKDSISSVGSAVTDLTRSMSEMPKKGKKVDDSDRRHSNPTISPISSRLRSDAVLEDSTSLQRLHLQPRLESVQENMMQFSDSSDDEPFDIDEVAVEFLFQPNKGDLRFSEDQIDGGCGQVGVALNPPRATTALVQALFMRLEHLLVNVACFPPAQCYTKLCRDMEFNGWDLYNFPKEMDRQGVSEKKWRLTIVNGPQYSLCSSYPQLMYIPASVKDDTLVESAKFRSKNRLPCLVWVDGKHQNFMMRCAQPLTGTSGKHSIADEQLIQSALDCGPQDSHITIFDARSYSAATGNKIMGKGTEDISHYARARLTHLDIPNIHAVRESYEALRSVCLSTVSGKWHSALESTQWLNYISVILKGSTMIARCMKLRQGNVLVHCSDGWDRTSQLTSLAQLMMDHYYRTINGFMILIEKEWLSFGHKFQERLGDPSHPNERSPIFLQFLDCVHQLICQFPSSFEFTSSLLLCIAEHLNTAWFGTFLCNCDKERHDLVLYARTVSVWAHLTAERENFLNPDYSLITEPIFPTRNLRRLRLWEEYFLRYDCTALAQRAKALDHDMIDQEPIALTGTLDHDSWSADTVVWMSDDRTSECCTCQQKFNTFRRRHHCRACGRIFCHECSKGKVVLNHLGYFSPVRVCEECHRKLNRVQRTSDTEDGFVLVSTNDKEEST